MRWQRAQSGDEDEVANTKNETRIERDDEDKHSNEQHKEIEQRTKSQAKRQQQNGDKTKEDEK